MKPLSFCFIIVLIFCFEGTISKSLTKNELAKKYLEELEQSGYNTQIMPESTKGDGNPVYISCSMYILDVFKVDEENMEFQTQFYFRQSWVDQRLAFPDLDIKEIVLNDVKYIWTPDLYFEHEKEGFLHNLITPNVFIKIEKDGSVFFSERLTMTFDCPMDFSKYPHDIQKCVITSQSFGFYRNKLEIAWFESVNSSKNINISTESINLPFKITNIKRSSKDYSISTGDYTTLEVEFTFQRKIGFFITRLYVPFIFLTILSWLSFWIPAKLVVHRLSLMIVIMYLMVDIGNYINTQAPKSWYMKGSDVWIAVCQSLVFASFLEFIAVHMAESNSQKKLCKNDPEAQSVLDPGAKINSSESKKHPNNEISKISSHLNMDSFQSDRIDKTSRIMFPVLFTVFNFIYWIVYCTGD